MIFDLTSRHFPPLAGGYWQVSAPRDRLVDVGALSFLFADDNGGKAVP